MQLIMFINSVEFSLYIYILYTPLPEHLTTCMQHINYCTLEYNFATVYNALSKVHFPTDCLITLDEAFLPVGNNSNIIKSICYTEHIIIVTTTY